MNWKIRPANENDLEQIENLHKAMYVEDSVNMRIESIKKIIEDDKKRDEKWAYVCDLEGKIIGVGVISEVSFLYGSKEKEDLIKNNFNYQYPSIELTRFVVDREYQNRGVGVRIGIVLEKIAQNVNTPAFYALLTTQNIVTQKMASRNNYKPSGILLAPTSNYYIGSKEKVPFHSVIKFKQKEKVENNLVIQEIYVNESTRPFVELVSGMNGMQDVSIKIADKKYENLDLGINEWNPGFDFSFVDLGFKSSTTKLEQLTQQGFIPTTLLPFYKVQFDNNGNGRYHHALAMQRFNIDPRLDLLKIDEKNSDLVSIRDYIVDSIK